MDGQKHTHRAKQGKREREREVDESKGHCIFVNGGGQCIYLCICSTYSVYSKFSVGAAIGVQWKMVILSCVEISLRLKSLQTAKYMSLNFKYGQIKLLFSFKSTFDLVFNRITV